MSWVSVFLCVIIGLVQVHCDEELDDYGRKPLYQYRYQTQDVMKTAETQVPVRGYHVVEGGYYPSESGGKFTSTGWAGPGFGGGFGGPIGAGVGSVGYGSAGVGSVGYGGVGGLGFGGVGGYGGYGGVGGGLGVGGYGGGPHFIGGGIGPGIGAPGIGGAGYIGGGGIGYNGYGGGEVDKKEYSGEKKNVNGEQFAKEHGEKKEEVKHGKEGYVDNNVAVKDVKGEGGYYENAAGGKKVYEDGKQYHGGQEYKKEGKEGGEKNVKQGHKKGHKIKGFKSSHHKDESGKTEEYYDEAHDEGDNYEFNGKSGQFGEHGSSSFKGGHEDGKFNKEEQKKSGHFDSESAIKKTNADAGKYGENKYHGSEAAYGSQNGLDQHSLLGHQEENRFFKHHPVPFFHHY